jgi:hypothetical protein
MMFLSQVFCYKPPLWTQCELKLPLTFENIPFKQVLIRGEVHHGFLLGLKELW